MKCSKAKSKFVVAFIAGAHALQSSSIPQEGEIISTDVQPPVLTIDNLTKDVNQIYKEGAEKIVNRIKSIVYHLLYGKILGTTMGGLDFLHCVCKFALDESQAVVLAELLLSKYKYNPNTKDDAGQHALILAAEANHPRVVKLLVQQGADIDHQDTLTKSTALHQAAIRGHLEVVNVLLESGANTSLKNTRGRTPVQCACPNVLVVAILKKHELRKSFAVVLGLNHYTTTQIVARKNQTNGEGLLKVGKAALLHILSFLKVNGE